MRVPSLSPPWQGLGSESPREGDQKPLAELPQLIRQPTEERWASVAAKGGGTNPHWGGLPHRVDAVQRAKGDGLGKEGDVVRHILLETLEGALASLLTRHGPSATSGAGAAAAATAPPPAP